jgi:hypothetical protein
MATSGTYAFNPSLGELTLYAFNMAGIRNTALTQEYMTSARMAANLMLSSWSNKGVNLWKVDLVTFDLQTGVSTYAAGSDGAGNPSSSDANRTVMVLDAYVTTTSGGQNIDRIILPVSRSEYASYPNKEQEGFPTIFWFDRLISPTITIWPVPNTSTGPATISFYRVTQVEDSEFNNGQTVDVPYRWLDAFSTGLAFRLSQIWMPAMAANLKGMADEAWGIAAQQDTENVSLYISPQISSYYR